jgi:hypothetical protein
MINGEHFPGVFLFVVVDHEIRSNACVFVLMNNLV